MTCPSCGHANHPDVAFCVACGASLPLRADPPTEVPYLFIHAGPERGESFPLVGDHTIVGTSSAVGIRLSDARLADRHFAVDRSGDQVSVEDLGSPDGTIVGRRRLRAGDRVAAPSGTLIEAGATIAEVVDAGLEPRLATPKVTGHPRHGRVGPRTRRALSLMGVFVLVVLVLSFIQSRSEPDATERAKSSTLLVAAAEGSGSGIVIDDQEGLVLTNHHVVAGGRAARVAAPGLAGWVADAEVVAAHPCEDVALLRLPAVREAGAWPDVEAIELAGAAPRAGDRVYALGYPATAGNVDGADTDVSVTGGIVSNPRTRYDDPTSGVMPLGSVIQHDAAINPGNSGGPLVDDAGRLLGMNTALYALADFRLEGQSYAITAERLRELLPALRAGSSTGDFGLLLEPFVGVLTGGDQPGRSNALVVRTVDARGPAAEAGLRPGMLIARVDGERVRTLADWCQAIAGRDEIRVDYFTPTGTTMQSTVLRSY
jgi:S1-C subfamily serine protease